MHGYAVRSGGGISGSLQVGEEHASADALRACCKAKDDSPGFNSGCATACQTIHGCRTLLHYPSEVRQCAGRTAKDTATAACHRDDLFVVLSRKVVPQRRNELAVESPELLFHNLGMQNTEGFLVWHVHGGNTVPGGLSQFGGQ